MSIILKAMDKNTNSYDPLAHRRKLESLNRTEGGLSALHQAVRNSGESSAKIVKDLIDQNVDVNIKAKAKDLGKQEKYMKGAAPLHLALTMRKPNREVIKLLVDAKANLYRKARSDMKTPLKLGFFWNDEYDDKGEEGEGHIMGGKHDNSKMLMATLLKFEVAEGSKKYQKETIPSISAQDLYEFVSSHDSLKKPDATALDYLTFLKGSSEGKYKDGFLGPRDEKLVARGDAEPGTRGEVLLGALLLTTWYECFHSREMGQGKSSVVSRADNFRKLTALYEAIESVIASEDDEDRKEVMCKAVAKYIEVQVNDPDLLSFTGTKGLGVKLSVLGPFYRTVIFRSVIRAKFESGPQYVFFFNWTVFFLLGVIYTLVTGAGCGVSSFDDSVIYAMLGVGFAFVLFLTVLEAVGMANGRQKEIQTIMEAASGEEALKQIYEKDKNHATFFHKFANMLATFILGALAAPVLLFMLVSCRLANIFMSSNKENDAKIKDLRAQLAAAKAEHHKNSTHKDPAAADLQHVEDKLKKLMEKRNALEKWAAKFLQEMRLRFIERPAYHNLASFVITFPITLLLFLMSPIFALVLGCLRWIDGDLESNESGRTSWYKLTIDFFNEPDGVWAKNVSWVWFEDLLTGLGFCKVWRNDPWNLIDAACLILVWIVLIWSSVYSIEETKEDTAYRNVCVVGALFMWLKFLGYVKGSERHLAAFVFMLNNVLYDVKEYIIVLCVFLLMFAHVFYLRLGREPIGYHDEGEDSHWQDLATTFQTIFTLAFLGDYESNDFPAEIDLLFADFFVIIIIIIMLNVLIAIISNSFEGSMAQMDIIFWRARMELTTEVNTIFSSEFFPRPTEDRWLTIFKDELMGSSQFTESEIKVEHRNLREYLDRRDQLIDSALVELKTTTREIKTTTHVIATSEVTTATKPKPYEEEEKAAEPVVEEAAFEKPKYTQPRFNRRPIDYVKLREDLEASELKAAGWASRFHALKYPTPELAAMTDEAWASKFYGSDESEREAQIRKKEQDIHGSISVFDTKELALQEAHAAAKEGKAAALDAHAAELAERAQTKEALRGRYQAAKDKAAKTRLRELEAQAKQAEADLQEKQRKVDEKHDMSASAHGKAHGEAIGTHGDLTSLQTQLGQAIKNKEFQECARLHEEIDKITDQQRESLRKAQETHGELQVKMEKKQESDRKAKEEGDRLKKASKESKRQIDKLEKELDRIDRDLKNQEKKTVVDHVKVNELKSKRAEKQKEIDTVVQVEPLDDKSSAELAKFEAEYHQAHDEWVNHDLGLKTIVEHHDAQITKAQDAHKSIFDEAKQHREKLKGGRALVEEHVPPHSEEALERVSARRSHILACEAAVREERERAASAAPNIFGGFFGGGPAAIDEKSTKKWKDELEQKITSRQTKPPPQPFYVTRGMVVLGGRGWEEVTSIIHTFASDEVESQLANRLMVKVDLPSPGRATSTQTIWKFNDGCGADLCIFDVMPTIEALAADQQYPYYYCLGGLGSEVILSNKTWSVRGGADEDLSEEVAEELEDYYSANMYAELFDATAADEGDDWDEYDE